MTSLGDQLSALRLDLSKQLLALKQKSGADGDDTAAIVRFVAQSFPDLEVEMHRGGQPLYPYYFGIE